MKYTTGLYNKIAKFYDLFDLFYEIKLYHKMRQKYITKITHAKILEIGVGTGKNLSYYSSANQQIVCIDQSREMLKEAVKKVEKLPSKKREIFKLCYVHGDWHLPENYFDVVVATYVLCTNTDPSDLIKQIQRVLKTDGHLILFEWVPPEQGTRKFILKLLHPLLYTFLGVSAYKKGSVEFFNKKRWIVSKKDYFDKENYVAILKKRTK